MLDIRALDLEELEESHDFIQWLFPLPEPSSANPYAPLLSQADIHLFVADQQLGAELIRSLEIMLRFFGFLLQGSPASPDISRAPNFEARRAVWLHRSNHNLLRITRILRSLSLLACQSYAVAFRRCLEDVYTEFGDVVGLRTIEFWRNAVTES